MKNVAIFASGTGTNALTLLESARALESTKIACVIIDNAEAPLLLTMKEKFPETKTYLILPDPGLRGVLRRDEHEDRILETLKAHDIEWILLAGYMRIIGQRLLGQFPTRILNIHPSLLPAYPGIDSYRRAFEDGVSESGVTIHYVDAGVDTGPIVTQAKFRRDPGDTLDTFTQKGKEIEWKFYPAILLQIDRNELGA